MPRTSGWRVAGLAAALASSACAKAPGHAPDAPDAGADGATDSGAGADAPSDRVVVDTGLGPWSVSVDAAAPVPLDDITVYAFSQTGDGQADPQVAALAPDMTMRQWQRWDTYGRTAGDFDFGAVAAAHDAGVKLFIGGTTATALFSDEFPNPQFPSLTVDDVDTRDATGAPVVHPKILPDFHRGSLANADFRAYLIRLCQVQIDGGVDGLYFDELNQGYQGANFDGDEGFDAAHLTDFNAYLLSRFPGADYQAMFGMTPDNLLKADVPAGDLAANFDYRRYLAAHGWASTPFAAANPLGKVWGQTEGGRPSPGMPDFVNTAEPYRYWGALTRALRDYARQQYGRSLIITTNGLYPLVDFQGVGLYNFNHDDAGGAEAQYVPVTPGSTTAAAHLDGTRSLQRPFLNLKARSDQLAPGVPVVLFIDWPTDFMSRYLHLPPSEQQDYWRIYAAEAYANGLFFAFFLQDTVGDATATQLGLMPLYQRLAAYYRGHKDLYHGTSVAPVQATMSLASPAMVAVSDQASPRRRLVHLVNHDYAGALTEHDGFTITVPLPAAPSAATLASPDLDADVTLAPAYANGAVTVVVPSLSAYDVIELAY